MKKKLLIFTLISLSFIPLMTFAIENTTKESTDSVKNIEDIVQHRTPQFIAGPIITLAGGIEQFRVAIAGLANNETARLDSEVKSLEAKDSTSGKGNEQGSSKFMLLWNKILLFFCNLLTFVLNTKWAFYTALFVFVILALRYILWFIFP